MLEREALQFQLFEGFLLDEKSFADIHGTANLFIVKFTTLLGAIKQRRRKWVKRKAYAPRKACCWKVFQFSERGGGSFGWLLIGSPGPEESRMHGEFPFVL